MDIEHLVSVVIPTYNRADVICRAIDSVVAQTYTNTEIIVVDDGSTDDSQTRMRSYGDRIRILNQKNAGPAIARNRGIAAARGEFVAFLDSDDYWLPTKLARQIELLKSAGRTVPCCLCNSSVQYLDGSQRSTFEIADTVPNHSAGLWLNPAEVLASRFVLFTQAAVIRRSVLERVGYFHESLRFYEDYELSLRLSLEGPWAIIRDSLVVYYDSSYGSLAQKALQESVRLHGDLVNARERILNLVKSNPRHAQVRRVLQGELRRARRELVASRLSERKFAGATSLAHLLRRIERIRRAIFRNSSLYPQMLVEQLG